MIEINEDFETMLVCAERYACGRRSYMPSIVVGYIVPLIPKLSDKTLCVIRDDITNQINYNGIGGGLGDPDIDAPLWRMLRIKTIDELNMRLEAK